MERTVFEVESGPSDRLIGRLSDLDPENPFCTSVYAGVKSRLGAEVSALLLRTDGTVSAGCLGFTTKGRLNSRFEITSFPRTPEPELFWNGLFEHCRATGITALNINSFGSAAAQLPDVPAPRSRLSRTEYIIDLEHESLWSAMNRRSRRMVTKAREYGMTLRRHSGAATQASHVELANLSLDRLRARGEDVSSIISADEVSLYIESGFGEIFQAVKDDVLYSTLLVVKGPAGAYCQSSGTSPEGRDLGASHFIFHETACIFKDEGFKILNIGGVSEENRGLREFKSGLGGRPVELESADYFLGGTLKKLLSRGMELIGR